MSTVYLEAHLSKPDLIKHLQDAFRDPSDLLEPIGVAMMAGMVTRLRETYATGDDVYRTGDLMRSLNVPTREAATRDSIFKLSPHEVTVGSSVKYAAVQSEGTGSNPIRPRTGKALAIPLSRNLKVSRKWPRHFAKNDLRFVPAKVPGRTIGYLVDAKGTLGFGEKPLFVLVTSVDIEPKGLAEAGHQYMLADLDGIFEDWIDGIDAEAA